MNEMKESMLSTQWIDGRGDGDVWKNKVRSLQLRIRDRFRVTVDKHRIRNSFKQRISDGYFSSTLQRWILRFRNLRRDSLPPSPSAAAYAFYRKRVSKDIDTTEDSILMRMLQAVAVPVIGNVCHVFMHGLNRVQVVPYERPALSKGFLLLEADILNHRGTHENQVCFSCGLLNETISHGPCPPSLPSCLTSLA